VATEITTPAVRDEAFQVATWAHLLGGFVSRHPGLWLRLGDMESSYLADEIAAVKIDRPIYIAGLARSGTTILLEVVASEPGIATHQYRDFPLLFTPYAWNWWLSHIPLNEVKPVERTHADGIFVTPESPEAMEEMIWMAMFPHLHDPARSNVLGADTNNSRFEAFYRAHVAKLILARSGRRYSSKENYNITRLEYLLKIFPDARFVIPVREPAAHIASLLKQHRMLSEGQRRQPRSLAHFQRIGHFEFGLDLRPINTGDTGRVREIQQLWSGGEEIRGWARYWAMIYEFVAGRLAANPALRAASIVVRYEEMCAEPEAILRKLCDHCGLDAAGIIHRYADRLRVPTYYSARFSDSDQKAIEEETAVARSRLSSL
jgi:hypothetical protein